MEPEIVQQQQKLKGILEKFKAARVMICSDYYKIIGQTYYSGQQRFIDMLNKDLILGEERISNFIVVTEAVLINPEGGKEPVAGPVFVGKDSIAFIGAFDETMSTTSKKVNSVNFYPWREKYPVTSKLILRGDHILTGQIFGNPQALPVHSVEAHSRFMPMVDVRILSSPEIQDMCFQFAAVNKDYLYLMELI